MVHTSPILHWGPTSPSQGTSTWLPMPLSSKYSLAKTWLMPARLPGLGRSQWSSDVISINHTCCHHYQLIYHITSHHITSHHITSHHITIISYHIHHVHFHCRCFPHHCYHHHHHEPAAESSKVGYPSLDVPSSAGLWDASGLLGILWNPEVLRADLLDLQ